ncbi:amino acid adenylation domain-containing protein [Epibacterium ulvae]|uniref:non-ribosomal peptide synthetase n=1 Tax=Epibacterium ulvae TaxID=1156985 RepID=UPI001BFCA2FF|nr:non-ribosomal peptide synthetase [Epibacterium ulvae]MBT8152592.1 amino acid adenylation domain-containing protein [Epibacterium ulvae]
MVEQRLNKNGESFPVTAMQMAMIYESAGSNQPWVNLEQLVLRFDTDFPQQTQLTAIWQELVARYDVLRSVISWQKVRRPLQFTLDHVDIAVVALDWSNRTPQSHDAALNDFLCEDRDAGLDLQNGPGWRLAWIRCAGDSGYVVITAHHAIVDGRSMAQIMVELLTGLETGTLPELQTTAKPFLHVAGEVVRTGGNDPQAKSFFESYLKGFENSGTLALPTAKPTISTAPDRVARKKVVSAEIGPEITKPLIQMGAACDATLANFVQAAWGLVLARWQGRDDVTLGTVRSGRHAVANSQGTIGCLINTLPLRMTVGRDTTLGQLANGLRQDTRAMHPFEQSPISEVRTWGGLGGHQPLFSTVVMFERGSMDSLVFDRYHGMLRPEISLHEEGGMPLTLAVYGEETLKILLEFDPFLITAKVARLLRDHLRALLQSMAGATPNTNIGALDMMSASERAALVDLGGPDKALDAEPADIVDRFYDIAKTQPDAVAVQSVSAATLVDVTQNAGDQAEPCTYAVLDQRSNGLAHLLHERGIGAGDMVAISMERSVDFVVSILAVLKRGAAFVPVDPTYPAGHQHHMLQDSGAKLVIAHNRASEVAGEISCISPACTMADTAPSVGARDPETPAYVIYTSGSTGVPKGVVVTRANIAAHAAAIGPAFDLGPADRVLQFASLSFDVALEEILPTLLSGARLVLRDAAMAQSPAAFFAALETQQITVANMPTAFWTVLTQYLVEQGRCVPECLRLAIVGGELVKPNVLQKWQHVAPNTRWMNGYGPTEATITSTLFEATEMNARQEVPIGRPTAHATAYVVAADGSLCPQGVEGELAIGGAAVAQGYLGLPEQTRDAFRPDLFSGRGRMYLTGDRVTWGDDRQLRFLGRSDRQVKLRGFRIDLRDVERAMEDILPDAQVIVDVIDRNQPTARLMAWVKVDTTPDRIAIGQNLRHRLPAQMRPEIRFVDIIPTTAGGKVDMKALPQSGDHQAKVVKLPDGGETALECRVQTIMARVLGRKSVSVTDDFYDLGGHSLMAVELLGRIETETGEQLGIMDLKENPTARGLARILETGSSAPKHIVPIQPKGNRPPLFAVHVLGKEECYFRPLARHLGEQQPILGVSVGALDENTPTGIEFTARRYVLDIMEYYPEGPINLMSVSLGSYVAFEMARQFRAAGRDVAFFAMFDATGPGGRLEQSGLARLKSHLRQARHLGLALPRHILSRRFDNFRYAQARRRAQKAAAQGNSQTPTSVSKLVAMNELAVASYEPRPIDVPLTIFRAQNNFFDSEEGIKSGLGWAPVAENGYTVVDTEGGHLSMLEEPHVTTLALHFAEILEQQQRELLERTRKRLLESATVPAPKSAKQNGA